MHILHHFVLLLTTINALPEYTEFVYIGNTYRIIEENARFKAFDSSRYDNAAKTCLSYFGNEWHALKVESYDEFNMIYTKVDELLQMTSYRSIWFGAAKANSNFDDPIAFQDDTYTEFGTFSGTTSNPIFTLNQNIFADLPDDKNGIDLFIDKSALNFGGSNKCIVMWLASNSGTSYTFPGVLSLEDCGRFFPPYVCQKSGIENDCGCTMETNNCSPLLTENVDPLAPFNHEPVSFAGTNTEGASELVYEYDISCEKPCFISEITIKGQQFANSNIKLIKTEDEVNVELVSVEPEGSETEVLIDNSDNEVYTSSYTFTEINNQNTDYRRRDSFEVKELLQLSSIRDWTLVKDVNGNTAIKLSPHLKGSYGFYSESKAKFYMFSKRNTMEVFDFATQTWNTAYTPASGSPYTNSFRDVGDSNYGGQMGTVINEIFYFQNDDEPTKIYTYDVNTDTVNRNYLSIPTGNGKCFTSSENMLYIINHNSLLSVDTSSVTPSYEEISTLPYDTSTDEKDNEYMGCGYLDGMINVFGGLKSDKVLKYDVPNNEWSIVSTSTIIYKGNYQAQVAKEQKLIFAARGPYIYRFDPKDSSLVQQIKFPKGSFATPILFSSYDNRLYALGGFYYGDTLTYRSNILAPKDPCEDVLCSDGQVCAAGSCQRDCQSFNIDGWLSDCSTKFTDVGSVISDIYAVMGNDANPLTIKERLNVVETDTANINTVIGTDNDASTLKGRLTVVETETSNIYSEIGNENDPSTIKGGLKVADDELIVINSAIGNDNDPATMKGRIKVVETEITDINTAIGNNGDSSTINGRITVVEEEIGNDADTSTIKGRVKVIEADITNINIAIGGDNDILTIKGRLKAGENKDFEIDGDILDINTAIGSDTDTSSTIKGRLNTLETVIGNDNDIGASTIKGRLNEVEITDVSTASQISDINTEIGNDDSTFTVKGRIKVLETQMQILTAAKIDGSTLSIIDDNGNSYFGNGAKDVLIISLLVTNMLTMIGLIIQCLLTRKATNKYRKYDQVSPYSSADDENAHLKH